MSYFQVSLIHSQTTKAKVLLSMQPWSISHSTEYNDIMPSILISKHVPHHSVYEVSALRSLAILFTVLLTMRTWEGS